MDDSIVNSRCMAFIKNMGDIVLERFGNEAAESGKKVISQIKQQLSGAELIEELEGSSIFVLEGCLDLASAVSDFLVNGRPRLSDSELPDFILQTRTAGARVNSPKHLNFLNGECAGCDVHRGHSNYERLRELKMGASIKQYLDELEFCLSLFQAQIILAQQFVYHGLRLHDFAGMAPEMNKDELAHLTGNYWFQITNLCVGNVALG